MTPAGSASDEIAAQMPMARARSAASGYARETTARVPGKSSAAPTPCTTRPATSSEAPGASPAASDPAPKAASPASTTRLCPWRSPRSPNGSISEARATA